MCLCLVEQRMTSASGVRATADVPNNSEPESLDSLAYDDWAGQFEFVGNNNNNINSSSSTNNSDTASTTSDVEDLNLIAPNKYTSAQLQQHQHLQSLRNCPILIDEETFLSMQSSDEPFSTLLPEQPNQLIENALKHLQFDNTVPSPHNKSNKSQNHSTHNANQIDVNNSSSLSINHNHNDNIIAMKNRRNCQTQQSDSNNNNNHNSCYHSDNAFKMSDMNFAHELYDSLLKEQVSDKRVHATLCQCTMKCQWWRFEHAPWMIALCP